MTTTETLEEFWQGVHGDAARWRTALRKAHYCSNQRLPDTHPQRCPTPAAVPAIEIGDRYFDTGEVIDHWRTAKLCSHCAVTPREPRP